MHRWIMILVGLAATSAQAVSAQGYPAKPVRFICTSTPGGGLDITARTLAQRLSQAVGQTFVVDNRSGATGSIGLELAAKSAPDGYTIVTVTAAYAANTATQRKLPFDLVQDFAPITQLTSQPYVLVIHPSVPASSLRELVATAKARPDGLSYGSSGLGGLSHFSGAQLAALTQTRLLHVPYKGGGPALADLLGGQISLLFATPLEATPHMRSGRIRALAVSTATRSRAMPELPTFAEAGVPGFEVVNWYGVAAPKATPRDIVLRLNREFARVLAMPEVAEQFSRDGVEPVTGTPEQFGEHLRAEITKWRRLVVTAGIQIP